MKKVLEAKAGTEKAAGSAAAKNAVEGAESGEAKRDDAVTGAGVPATQAGGAVAEGAIDYESDAGVGLEGADKDSFAIPFLLMLQPLSPIVVDETIEGVKAGHMLNSVTNENYGDTAIFIPCAFQRRWIRWAGRDTGGGFKGELTAPQVAELRANGSVKELENRLYFPESDGTINEKKSDRLADTRSHYVLLLRSRDDRVPRPAIMALTSTGIRVSKNLVSRIDSIKKLRADGSPFTPPSFSHMYQIKTVKKQNDKGTWWQPEISMIGEVTDKAVYNAAKAFHQQVVSGQATAAHETMSKADGGDGSGDTGGF